MTYRGRIENGIVAMEPGANLREGTDVYVEPVSTAEGTPEGSPEVRDLRKGLLAFSGVVKGGPSDLARNHDHYLHGMPRK
jgi:hypothetical protein